MDALLGLQLLLLPLSATAVAAAPVLVMVWQRRRDTTSSVLWLIAVALVVAWVVDSGLRGDAADVLPSGGGTVFDNAVLLLDAAFFSLLSTTVVAMRGRTPDSR